MLRQSEKIGDVSMGRKKSRRKNYDDEKAGKGRNEVVCLSDY